MNNTPVSEATKKEITAAMSRHLCYSSFATYINENDILFKDLVAVCATAVEAAVKELHDHVAGILDKAGIPIGNETVSYPLFERLRILVGAKDYFARQTDIARARVAALTKALDGLLNNSAVITSPDGDPCFVDLQCNTRDYEAAYDALVAAPSVADGQKGVQP